MSRMTVLDLGEGEAIDEWNTSSCVNEMLMTSYC